MITKNRLKPVTDRIDCIKNYPKPSTKKLRRFFGMVNFYHHFLLMIAKTLNSPYNLLQNEDPKKDKPIQWNQKTEYAFEEAKKAVANAALLTHLITNAKLVLSTDASAIGGVLQKEETGRLRPLAFFSKKLKPNETKYSAFDKELLAIYLSVKHFRYLIEGREFEI